MRATARDDRIAVGTVLAAIAVGFLGFDALAIWALFRYPYAASVGATIGMGVSIVAMDLRSGEIRRAWAWSACACGLVASLALLLS